MKFECPTATQDQALIAFVTSVAEKALSDNEGYLGRTALQKVLYFLQVCGIPMKYRFDVHHYGPFCPHILNDVDWLSYIDAIEDRSKNPDHWSDYRLGENGQELIDEYKSALSPYSEPIRKVVRALVPMSPDRLELLSTLDYANRELRVSLRKPPTKQQVINRFQEFKKDRFPLDKINEAYDSLKRAKLIESSDSD